MGGPTVRPALDGEGSAGQAHGGDLDARFTRHRVRLLCATSAVPGVQAGEVQAGKSLFGAGVKGSDEGFQYACKTSLGWTTTLPKATSRCDPPGPMSAAPARLPANPMVIFASGSW